MAKKMSRKIQCYDDLPHDPWGYYTKEMNPCRCGSNCQHYEYDGKNVFVVCNGCWSDLAIIKPEYAEEYLNKGIWRNMAEVYGTGTD